MTSRREVLKTSGYLMFARLFTRLASVPFLVYVAATLGPSLFGVLSFIIASVEMVSSLGDLGLSRYGARTLVRAKDGKDRLAGIIFIIQLGSSVILTVAVLVFIVALRPESPKLQVALLGLGGIMLSAFIFSTETIFTGARRFGASAILTIIGKVVYLILGFVALLLGYSVVALMAAYIAAMAIESALRMFYTVSKVTPFSFRFSAAEFKDVARGTIPFAVTALATLVFYRADIIIMGFIRGDADVGIYSVAYSFFSFLVWVPIVLSRSLLPGLTAKSIEAPAEAEKICWFWYRTVLIFGTGIAFVITMLARPVIETLMPAAFGESIITLQILIWSIPQLFMVSIGFVALTVKDRESMGARTTVITAIAIVIADVILIRLYGPRGAAAAMVGATTMWVALIHWLLARNVFSPRHGVLRTFGLPLAAAAAMTVTSVALVRYGTAAALTGGLMAYSGAILIGWQLERRAVSLPAGT